jgi:hypothetical protein
MFRTDKEVNMVAKFVVEHIGNREFTETRYPQRVKFDPRGLPLPFPVIKTGHAGLKYPAPSGSCFAETMSPGLIRKTTQNDTVKPANILVGNSSD